jgi:hypothetical protein
VWSEGVPTEENPDRMTVRFGRNIRAKVKSSMRKSTVLMALGLSFAASLTAASDHGVPVYGDLTTARAIAAAPTPRPGYLEPASDPAFRTPFMRITDPGGPSTTGTSCGPAYCTHRYSSSQAWNADQSLLLIANGCHGFCFLDGQTYRPLFRRSVPNECEWHPAIPSLMICVNGNEIYTWAPRSDTKTSIYVADTYKNLQFGPYKGNPSKDGSRLVVRATDSAGALVAFAYDIFARIKFPDIKLAGLPGTNGYCTISPSGRYIFCGQTTWIGTDEGQVFTVGGEHLQHWSEHHRPGHGDMTIDVDGSDVYVGISKAAPDKYHIIKRRLQDGAVTDLAPYGEGQHASIRNTGRPGWVFLSYAGSHAAVAGRPGWAPFYQEVVALRIDGSGTIRRIVQTRNEKHDYWSETHASPSPDGSQVIWSSNWGEPGGFVADYVARLSWPSTESPD